MWIGDWLQQNASLLGAVGNLLLVLIWGIYLHMFYRQSQRQQKAELLIHYAHGPDASASCLLVNMSREVIHIQCVMLEIQTQQDTRVHQVTDYRRISADDGNPQQWLRQGPLGSGDYFRLGRFESILPEYDSQQEQNGEDHEAPALPQDVQALELRAVAIHGPSDYLIGARRRFVVEHHDGQARIRPDRLLTEQLSSRRDRPEVRRWLRDYLAESGFANADWPELSERGRGKWRRRSVAVKS